METWFITISLAELTCDPNETSGMSSYVIFLPLKALVA